MYRISVGVPVVMKFSNSMMIADGWFDILLMYNGVSFGLRKGQYLLLLRLSVRSRKLKTFRLVSMVIPGRAS